MCATRNKTTASFALHASLGIDNTQVTFGQAVDMLPLLLMLILTLTNPKQKLAAWNLTQSRHDSADCNAEACRPKIV